MKIRELWYKRTVTLDFHNFKLKVTFCNSTIGKIGLWLKGLKFIFRILSISFCTRTPCAKATFTELKAARKLAAQNEMDQERTKNIAKCIKHIQPIREALEVGLAVRL